MVQRSHLTKIVIITAVAMILLLNLYTFVTAYPETYTINPGINTSGTPLAKDFSAYYMGAWRLWNNPAHIYNFGALNDGEPTILPHPEEYKYSAILSPNCFPAACTKLSAGTSYLRHNPAYASSLNGIHLYKLLEKKHVAATVAVMVIALLLPFPTINQGVSPSYYWQWGEGQAKVFLTFLLLLSFLFWSQR